MIFLDKVRMESDLAVQNDQPFLCIMIGHVERFHGFVLGDVLGYSVVREEEFKEALNRKARTTILSTSCYSGG